MKICTVTLHLWRLFHKCQLSLLLYKQNFQLVNLLSVENLSKSFGEKLLFENLSFGLDQGQKVALIAGNGSGKSTLLNIIMGLDIPDSGKVVLRADIKIAYLTQTPVFNSGENIVDVILNSSNQFVAATREYEEAIMAVDQSDNAENKNRLDKAISRMDALQAWDYESRVKEVLGKLNIGDLHRKMGTLSGGQVRKVALAKVLIDEVDLLIMDEPTNHLDIDMIEWLEDFLNKQRLTLLLVTHDRYFLDNVCEEIYELDHFGMFQYKGDYAWFVEKKAEREARERLEVEKAKNIYRTELEWMRRMPKARTHKSKSRIDAFYDLEQKAKRRLDEERPEFRVKVSRIGNNILELNNIHKAYPDGPEVISDFSYTFKRGERIGVVGPNGAGKSTLFRLIMGEEKLSQGSIKVGQTMVFGYFSQINPPVKPGKRVIELVRDVAEEIPFGNSSTMSAVQFLSYFNFDPTTQYNYYENLSGGEKRRLHLCLILVHNPNFLILDEPTNDLDIPTLNILEDFLMRYTGCLMIATHDRAFLDKLADHIFVFGENGKIKDYYSNYSAYRLERLQEEMQQKKVQQEAKEKHGKPRTNIPRASFRQQQEYNALSSEIEMLETEKTDLLALLSGGETDSEKLQAASKRYADLTAILEEKELRWLELSEICG